jgi:hypothetical protein
VELKVVGGYVSGSASSPFGVGYLPPTKIGADGKAAIPIGVTGGTTLYLAFAGDRFDARNPIARCGNFEVTGTRLTE